MGRGEGGRDTKGEVRGREEEERERRERVTVLPRCGWMWDRKGPTRGPHHALR